MTILKLRSNDGQVFPVNVEVACCSTTIKGIVDNLGTDENSEEEIPVDVRGEILKKVLDWAERYTKNKDIVSTESTVNVESDWAKEFLHMENETLFELVRAANYLLVESLLDLTCTAVANKLNGKTAPRIRQLFGLKP